jgi:hypothetical protein
MTSLVLACTLGCTIPTMAEEQTKTVEKPEKAAAPKPAVHELQKIETGMVIDGDLTKPQWKAAEVFRADYSNAKTGVLSETPRMTVRYLWDDHYLYIGYEFFSTDLQAQGNGQMQGPADNKREGAEIWLKSRKVDIAEFFITFKDPHFLWELHHNELNQFNDLWITVPDPSWRVNQQANVPYGIVFSGEEYVNDEGEYKLATAVKLLPKADGKPSTVNDASDVDTGYSAELRIPLWGIGAARSRMTKIRVPATVKGEQDTFLPGAWKMAGEEIQLFAVYQAANLADNDRYYHSGPTKPPGGWFHQVVPHYPTFKFVDNLSKPK